MMNNALVPLECRKRAGHLSMGDRPPFKHNPTLRLTSNCRSCTSIIFKRPTTPTISVTMVGVAVLYFFSNVPPFRHEVININYITIIVVL
jgi:hypothetical protein